MKEKKKSTKKITHAEIRMYKMGTGDCFVIKFFAEDEEKYKMMIDCGTWSGKSAELEPYIKDLKQYVNNSIDLLVVTHEHKDHVYVFEACEDLFTKNFEVKKIWMAWTENDSDKVVSDWQKTYGQKKKALAFAAMRLNMALGNESGYAAQFNGLNNGKKMLAARKEFVSSLESFADLHVSNQALSAAKKGSYIGLLEGMRIVKEEIANDNIDYKRPGDIIDDIDGLEGVKFFVLGPPLTYNEVKKESGGPGESYAHTKDIPSDDAFAAAVLNMESENPSDDILPFDATYTENNGDNISGKYNNDAAVWRRIDFDWMYNAGSLALRMNSITNNLSLALAIEFEDSGRVMLFPGDAEYGSWESWHRIEWNDKSRDPEKPLMEDLLNRTVFYKVAHHLSHNGTAERLGMDMMTNKDLAAMATLDYSVIPPGWAKTMPNRGLLKDLINQSKGRVMIMQEKDLFYDHPDDKTPLRTKILEARSKMNKAEAKEFKDNYTEDTKNGYYLQYKVVGL